MARPIKHSADYFSHDNNMRNDMKIRALRRKYKSDGYALYIMILEFLTSNEYFEVEWNEENIELLSPDFDMDSELISEIVDYSIKLNLLQLTNGYLHCDTLTDRLEETLLTRRKGYCRNNSKRIGLSGVNVDNNIINVDNNTQSKVKESKAKESKVKQTKVKDIIDKAKLSAVYTSPDIPEIKSTDIDYTIDESDYEITRPMLDRVIEKFIAVDNRFKFQSVMREIDEDYGGFQNLIELYLPNDLSAQKNYLNKLNQYTNGIFA